MVMTSETGEQFAQRATADYLNRIEPLVGRDNRGKYVTLDVVSGDWEMGDDILALSERLHDRHPNARLFTVRVGYPTASRIGFGGAEQFRP